MKGRGRERHGEKVAVRERGGGGTRVADAGCFMKQAVVVGGIDESARRTPQ